MAKRVYRAPALMNNSGLVVDDDPTIVIGGSQGTAGEDVIYTFEDEDLKAIIGGFNYFDLEEMDLDGDGEITWDEYNNWK